MTPAKTHRLDARIDAETDARISEAAALLHESVSSFVTRVVRLEADRVLGRADVTVMPAEQFDAMMESLDTPDEAPGLSQTAAQLRRFRSA
jgi:uncharacterized protein (DUF1778 family)